MAALVVSVLVLAGLACLYIIWWAPQFDSCRVFYRTHNVAADTLRCRAFSVLNVATMVLFIVAAVAALAWSFLLSRGRRNGTAST
jgi:hypothetical protein